MVTSVTDWLTLSLFYGAFQVR